MADHPPAQRAPIVFGLAEQPKGPSVLDEAREEHRRRAERFGVEYVEPARARPDLRLEARRERVAKSGFVTGIDFFSAEEEEKRRRRAAKFGLAPPADGDNNTTAPPNVALDPDDDPAELERRRARAERFGVPLAPPKPPQQRVGAHDGVMDVDALEAPADAPLDAEPRPEAVYLYGVDLLSTSECLRYFTEYGPTFVEWLNDSACVVVFADGPSAQRAMHGTGVALPREEGGGGGANEAPPPQQPQEGNGEEAMDGAEAGAVAAAVSSSAAGVQWFRGRDFVKAGTAVSLLYRGATQADKRDMTAPKPPSRYLWKTVGGGAPVGSKRGRRGGDGDGGGGGGGGYRGPHGGGGGGQQQGRRRRRMDGSYEEVDMADADGADGNGGGGGEHDEERWARGRGRGGGGGGFDSGDGGGEQQQREGPRRVVRARRRNGGGGGQGEQEQAPGQPQQERRQPFHPYQRHSQQQQQEQQGDGQQQQQQGERRRGRGRRTARSFRDRGQERVGFLEIN